MPTELLPTYVGPSTSKAIIEQARTEIAADIYGLDTFSATFQGPKTKAIVDRFVGKLKENATHRDLVSGSPYNQFAVNTYTLNTDRSFATFQIEFVGKLDGKEPPSQVEHSLVRRTAEIRLDDELALEIDYFAPHRKHTFVSREFPDTPRFSGADLFKYRLQIIDIHQLKDLPAAFLQPGFVQYTQISVMEEPSAKQRGTWWECEEGWTALLLPFGTLNAHSYATRV